MQLIINSLRDFSSTFACGTPSNLGPILGGSLTEARSRIGFLRAASFGGGSFNTMPALLSAQVTSFGTAFCFCVAQMSSEQSAGLDSSSVMAFVMVCQKTYPLSCASFRSKQQTAL